MELREAAKALGLRVEGVNDVDLLSALQLAIRQGGGEARRYVNDVRELPPEVVSVDHMRFEAELGVSGTVETQAVSVRVRQGYDFVLREIRGYLQEAAADQTPDNWTRVLFNAREEGRDRDLFASTISMGELLATLGPGPVMHFDWPAVYRFRGGVNIQPEFTINTTAAGPGAWTTSTNQKVVGVVFLGDLVVSKGA